MRALVTGASSGIGLELARQLAQRGYHLVLAARSAEPMEELAEQLPYGATVIPIDLARPGSARQLFSQCRDYELEVVVNNAGFGKICRHENIDAEVLEQMCHLNITTLSELCALFGQQMREKGRGHILNVGSVAAYVPVPFFANYAATKAFVRSLSLSLSEEYADFGVRVCCLSPGPTATGFGKVAKPRGAPLFRSPNTMTAQEVARLGLAGLFAGQREVVTGSSNWLVAQFSSLLPSWLVLKLAARNFERRLSE